MKLILAALLLSGCSREHPDIPNYTPGVPPVSSIRYVDIYVVGGNARQTHFEARCFILESGREVCGELQ